MEITIAEKWLREMESELALMDDVEVSPVERLRHTMPLITRFIADIKKLVLDEGFNSPEAEIHFFKQVKPRFYAYQIFEVLLYNLRMQTPAGTPEMIRAFYEDELQQVFRLFRVEAFYYQYYRTKATELDHVYFLREANPGDMPELDFIDPPPGFSTAMDYKFAKYIAYEWLRDHLLELLMNAQTSIKIQRSARERQTVLKWTGDAINLVELAYGIWLTGQVNNGNAGIAEIMQWLEVNLQVTIGRPFRRWQSISNRKRVSPVKYIDQMKAAILKRLDDENA
jgi:hypothetical protein